LGIVCRAVINDNYLIDQKVFSGDIKNFTDPLSLIVRGDNTGNLRHVFLYSKPLKNDQPPDSFSFIYPLVQNG
jgi:hypothetical protein